MKKSILISLCIIFLLGGLCLAGELKLTEQELLKLQNYNLKIQNLNYQLGEIQKDARVQIQQITQEKNRHIAEIEKRLGVKLDEYLVDETGVLKKIEE